MGSEKNKENADQIPLIWLDYLAEANIHPDNKTIKSVLNTVIPNKYVLPVSSFHRLQDKGYHEYESGYSIMQDGTGYIAVYLTLPGVTPEMFDWFFSWHPVAPVQNHIWGTGKKISTVITEKDRQQLLSSLPFNERIWGVHVLYREESEHDISHDMLVSYHSPYEYGFSKQTEDAGNWTAICANDGSICFFLRAIEGGSELRIRVWCGINTSDIEKEFSLPQSYLPEEEADSYIKKTAIHIINDFTNISCIIPQLYRDHITKNCSY